MKKKRVALYVRVSTDEQNTDAQERALKEYIQRRGWLLHHIYKDTGISGTASSRPGLNELMKDCRRRAIAAQVDILAPRDPRGCQIALLPSAPEARGH